MIVGVLVVPLLGGAIGSSIGDAGLGAVYAFVLVVIAVLVYAFGVAPYEQRNELRNRLAAQERRNLVLRGSVHRSLITRDDVLVLIMDEAPVAEATFTGFTASVMLKNAGPLPIEYEMTVAQFVLQNVGQVSIPLPTQRHHLWPEQQDTYQLPVAGLALVTPGVVGTLELVARYGSPNAVDRYERRWDFEFMVTPVAGVPHVYRTTSHLRGAGGHDRLIAD